MDSYETKVANAMKNLGVKQLENISELKNQLTAKDTEITRLTALLEQKDEQLDEENKQLKETILAFVKTTENLQNDIDYLNAELKRIKGGRGCIDCAGNYNIDLGICNQCRGQSNFTPANKEANK